MKVHKRGFVGLVVVALLLAACGGGSSDTAGDPATLTATEVPVATPTEVAAEEDADEPTPTPTEVPAPVVSDQERIDAVIAAMDAAIAVGEAPNGSIAYDLLGSKVNEAGDVTLNICEWTGDTVHDEVRDSLWRTSVDEDGEIRTQHVTTSLTVGDCTNTQMIETALAAASAFDSFWNEVVADPTVWQGDTRQELLGPVYRERSANRAASFLEDDVYFVASSASELGSVVNDILWRTVPDRPQDLLEFVFCRDMNPDGGMYRDGVLIDDGRSADSPGMHAIDAIQLVPNLSSTHGWQVAGFDGLIWSDCLGDRDWPLDATIWRSGDIEFEVLAQ